MTGEIVIFTMEDGKTIDTGAMAPEERHIIQKLLAWQSLSESLAHFRAKKKEALEAGWNNSGPVRESRALAQVILHLENQVRRRLAQ